MLHRKKPQPSLQIVLVIPANHKMGGRSVSLAVKGGFGTPQYSQSINIPDNNSSRNKNIHGW